MSTYLYGAFDCMKRVRDMTRTYSFMSKVYFFPAFPASGQRKVYVFPAFPAHFSKSALFPAGQKSAVIINLYQITGTFIKWLQNREVEVIWVSVFEQMLKNLLFH